jgi:type IV pilus assembly protein PilB
MAATPDPPTPLAAAYAQRIPYSFARTHGVLPVGDEAGAVVVWLRPDATIDGMAELKRVLQKPLVTRDVDAERFAAALARAYNSGTAATISEDLAREPDLARLLQELPPTEDLLDSGAQAPVIRVINALLLQALRERASDLHFEPYEYNYRVRFRIDGELREITQPPIAIKDKLASRIKVISRMDIAEKRVPQDGRLKLKFGNKAIDFRISTLPTLFGEKIVIRILDPSSAKLGIEALGYEKIERDRLMQVIQRPYGMVLVTGPTGSGKTVSLYTCLNILNQPGVNICTVEDPAEINLPGVNQVNVNDKAGLTFAAALKSFLRQDPDIIMVGEIRDLETADIAIKAAQTGHMVMSTLHTNDAPTTLTRLLNMGVAPFNIAASVLLITAQRLARRLCENCKAQADYPREALLRAGFVETDLDGSWKPYRAVGCSACNNGYKGRVGLYQVMPITDAIQRIILAEGTSMDIATQAQKEGVRDLRQSGLMKVRSGATTLEEVISVTNE